ncbi:MAG TPA: class I SAM-dependent methyltransferase [Candidatus Omnitrophota bacterium]|nr:class I SAM-dependent methyltransferase [Candidatus Omnitrophota bacterium]HPD84096.1 class I SAM-dependent methyltransferase [Candidatus Omnitrophota bacterium]HRZ02953.1 class I SAM-dependent methyltransferase [Candidatus Omnitrophota bacterium]
MDSSSAHLEEHYTSLGNLKSDFRNKNLYELISSCLDKKTLLDIGCGAGHFLNIAHEKGFQVSGVEPDQKLIDLSRKLYPGNLNITNCPAEQIDTIRGKFDNITVIDVLEHVEDDMSVLKKIKGLLAEDGRLIILVPCHPHLYGKRDKAMGHYRRYSKSNLVDKLEKNGYRILKLRFWNMLGYLPYLISEKVLQREISSSFRENKSGSPLHNAVSKVLNLWFKYAENAVNFGFGLSLICVVVPRETKEEY